MLSKGVTDDLEELRMEVLAKSNAKADAVRRAAAADVPLPASKGALARSITAAKKRRELAKAKPKAAPKAKKPKKVKVVKEEKPNKLTMTAKCITSRAYKHARSKAIEDGESPEKAMEIGTLAFL